MSSLSAPVKQENVQMTENKVLNRLQKAATLVALAPLSGLCYSFAAGNLIAVIACDVVLAASILIVTGLFIAKKYNSKPKSKALDEVSKPILF